MLLHKVSRKDLQRRYVGVFLLGWRVCTLPIVSTDSNCPSRLFVEQVSAKKPTKTETAVAIPASSLQSSGTVDAPNSVASLGETATGPRQSGARRSTPRNRKGASGSQSS